MTIHRVHRKKHGFSMILNEGAENIRLTWAARGLLWYLLTKPDGWQVHTEHLVAQSDFEGEKKVKSILKELESHGYILRWCDRGQKGRLIWHSEIFESAADSKDWLENNKHLLEGVIRLSKGASTMVPLGGHGEKSKKKPQNALQQKPHESFSQDTTMTPLSTHGERHYGQNGSNSDRDAISEKSTITPLTIDGATMGGQGHPLVNTERVNTDLAITDLKNSLSPKGSLSPIADEKQPNSRERETGASALLTAQQPTAITTTATAPPRKKPSLERSQTSNGQTQYSAAPPPEIFELSQWADFRAPGNHAEFWESVLRRAQRFKNRPESPECAAETWIRKQGHLLWAEFQKVQSNGNGNGHHPQPIYHCEIEYPNNLQWYMENPEIDLAEHIAKVESNWLRLDLKPNDDRWINWLQKVEPDLEPAHGPSNLPDWVLRKLADDLSKTPC